MEKSERLGAMISGAFWFLLIVGLVFGVIFSNQINLQERAHEADLIEGGHCLVVARELYNPRAGALPGGYPFLRDLWRCNDPWRDQQGVEFWRRTSEEFGK